MRKSLLVLFAFISLTATAQVNLTTSPYTENFDNIGTGSSTTTSGTLPAGFTVKKSATTTSVGVDSSMNVNVTPPWRSTLRGFKNFASATGVSDNAIDSLTQRGLTNRALGVRQTSAFGDPGAAFVFQIANTTGKFNFQLSFLLQSLDPTSPRTTTWVVDYGIGASPSTFTPVTTAPALLTTGGSTFSNTTVTVNFGSALNDLAQPVWIRVWASPVSTGSGNRPSTAIDDWSLSWGTTSPVRNIINDDNYIKITGNPSNGALLTFNKTIAGNVQLQLTNLNGQIVWQKQLNRVIEGQVEQLNYNNLPKGVYLLSVISKDGTFSKRLMN